MSGSGIVLEVPVSAWLTIGAITVRQINPFPSHAILLPLSFITPLHPPLPATIITIDSTRSQTFGLLAQLTLVMALQRETGGKIAMLGYFKIVFSVIVQSIYTGTIPTLVAFIGMTIITVAGVWSAVSVPHLLSVYTYFFGLFGMVASRLILIRKRVVRRELISKTYSATGRKIHKTTQSP